MLAADAFRRVSRLRVRVELEINHRPRSPRGFRGVKLRPRPANGRIARLEVRIRGRGVSRDLSLIRAELRREADILQHPTIPKQYDILQYMSTFTYIILRNIEFINMATFNRHEKYLLTGYFMK